MKAKFLPLLAAIIGIAGSATKVNAQETYPYDYSYATQNYTALSNPTVLLANVEWDDTLFELTIPFTFVYQGENVTEWIFDSYGALMPSNMPIETGLAITGIYSDYVSRPNSQVGMEVTGATGSRIAKIEYKNVGFYDAAVSDSASFQIWLYEGSNKIEYHVGPSNTQVDFFDPVMGNFLMIGLGFVHDSPDSIALQAVNYDGGNNTDQLLTFDMNNPDPSILFDMIYGTNYPVNGSVFSFAPPEDNTGLAQPELLAGKIYPNPATDRIIFELNNRPSASATLMITDIAGKKILDKNVSSQSLVLDVSTFAPGVYFYTYSDKGKAASGRFVKK